MAGKIFVSYRRDDDPHGAARVRDGLAARFGKTNLFMDVDDLLAGLRFDDELAKALAACDVFIAVIGVRWMDLLKAKASSGERDYVREEIAAALERRIVVIPVRVGRDGQLTPLPRVDDLAPAGIADLVHYQKHDVTHENFGRDIGALADAITVVRRRLRAETALATPRVSRLWVGAVFAGVLAIGYAGAHYAGVSVPWPGTAPGIADDSANANAAAQAKRRADEAEKQRLAAEVKRKADEEAVRRDPAIFVEPGSGQSFRDRLVNGQSCSFCAEMVVVPAGQFTMGSSPTETAELTQELPSRAAWWKSEWPQHKVTIPRPFAVGRFAVTFDEWDACVSDGGCNGYKPQDDGWGRDKRPVINVNWDDAKAYAAWLSRKTGKSYRLLSETEREYAARAGTTSAFWWGASISTRQANYDGNYTFAGGAKGEYLHKTVPVDSFEANPWGLYQVHGNVYDWTEDCWHDSYQSAPTDGSAWTTACTDASRRVVRGGSWGSLPQDLRSASRYRVTTGFRNNDLGFRLARTLKP